jgi:hypothetical protein
MWGRWLVGYAVLACVAPTPGSALVLRVDSVVDAVDASPGDGSCGTAEGVCSLRAAVMESRVSAGMDRIEVPPGTYRLTIPGADEWESATGDLNLRGGVELVGLEGAEATVIDAGGLDRAIQALHGTTIRGVTVTDGVAGAGGGIEATSGSVRILGCVIRGNRASQLGGGIFSGAGLELADSVVADNVARNGGGIYVTSSPARVLRTSIERNAAQGGPSDASGGGVFVAGPLDWLLLTLDASVVRANTATRSGGGIFSMTSVQVSRTLIEGNVSSDFGGGVSCLGALDVRSSTVAHNEAGSGGGISAYQLFARDTTISGNRATNLGGGAYVGEGDLQGCTITENSTIWTGGGIRADGANGFSRIALGNSIVAGNAASIAPDCTLDFDGVSLGHNLIGDGTGCEFTFPDPTDRLGTADAPIDPLLAPLHVSFGPVPTHVPLAGSPAIDTGSPELPGTSEAACSLVDARGVPRALDGDGDGERRCDVGAVEVILAACTNGVDDDADGATDAADPECQSAPPWWDDEARPAPGCGLGWELAVPLLLLRRGARLGRSRSRYSIRTPVV